MLTLKQLKKDARRHHRKIEELMRLDINWLHLAALGYKRTGPLQFFAPLYMSNVCGSTCAYCAFKKGNPIKRTTLTLHQAEEEVAFLKNEGYDAVYCLTGSFPEGSLAKRHSMTEVNARGLLAIRDTGLFPILESSPFSLDNLRSLLGIAGGRGRFVLFQESYNETTYRHIHGNDPFKGNPEKRLQQLDLARKAGWPELGIGFLIGLHPDITSELAHLIAHYDYLMNIGAHQVTISVPRINKATGVNIVNRVTDEQFLKIIYVIRIMRPDAPIVLTGREQADIRNALKPITNIWGARGSTVPGGYTQQSNPKDGQFHLEDKRSIKECTP